MDVDVIGRPEPRHGSRRAQWLGGLAALGIGVTLGAAGIAAAADDPTPTPSPGAGAQVTPPGPPPGGPGMHRGHGRGPGGPGGPGLRGAVHGEFVVPDGTGWRTVAVQRGEVTSVSSTSLSVKSKDGYTKTYVVTPDTMVNAARDGIGSIKTGEDVAVVANVKGGTATAVDIRDLSQIKQHRKDFGPPGGPPNAPNGTPASPSSFDEDSAAQPA
ncbi:MAG: hypothetical protein QOE05_1119 [Actinomycetota bacterium]|jgi:hypothetical protein|nr:hypothetical protein [Actinomycetota bacterium]